MQPNLEQLKNSEQQAEKFLANATDTVQNLQNVPGEQVVVKADRFRRDAYVTSTQRTAEGRPRPVITLDPDEQIEIGRVKYYTTSRCIASDGPIMVVTEGERQALLDRQCAARDVLVRDILNILGEARVPPDVPEARESLNRYEQMLNEFRQGRLTLNSSRMNGSVYKTKEGKLVAPITPFGSQMKPEPANQHRFHLQHGKATVPIVDLESGAIVTYLDATYEYIPDADDPGFGIERAVLYGDGAYRSMGNTSYSLEWHVSVPELISHPASFAECQPDVDTRTVLLNLARALQQLTEYPRSTMPSSFFKDDMLREITRAKEYLARTQQLRGESPNEGTAKIYRQYTEFYTRHFFDSLSPEGKGSQVAEIHQRITGVPGDSFVQYIMGGRAPVVNDPELETQRKRLAWLFDHADMVKAPDIAVYDKPEGIFPVCSPKEGFYEFQGIVDNFRHIPTDISYLDGETFVNYAGGYVDVFFRKKGIVHVWYRIPLPEKLVPPRIEAHVDHIEIASPSNRRGDDYVLVNVFGDIVARWNGGKGQWARASSDTYRRYMDKSPEKYPLSEMPRRIAREASDMFTYQGLYETPVDSPEIMEELDRRKAASVKEFMDALEQLKEKKGSQVAYGVRIEGVPTQVLLADILKERDLLSIYSYVPLKELHRVQALVTANLEKAASDREVLNRVQEISNKLTTIEESYPLCALAEELLGVYRSTSLSSLDNSSRSRKIISLRQAFYRWLAEQETLPSEDEVTHVISDLTSEV